MSYPLKAGLGFALGSVVGIIVSLLLTVLLSSMVGFEAGDSHIGSINLIGIGGGGFIAGMIGGAALDKGFWTKIGYGFGFMPLFYLYAISLPMFI